ncbi:hypothetical protein CORC01_08023 [Colletotrichum orchidophilum]|uniref:SprT-like domain-containing protein n=1 Tax=Colletotrichum orchidophilum TaxID=1209926 RepID=A0A1G4B5V8_9PEZI|nr:uncharacterized protein CORC01_08023 [Colletotrichum orchidophilum]OHE96706.1 hypothetical protein CORC01_08023 [Colletotrichum orchidophilum]
MLRPDMAESKRARFLPQRCQHHSRKSHQHDQVPQPQSHNINDVAITLSECMLGPVPWAASEKSLKNNVARVLVDKGADTNPRGVSASTIFSLMKAIDELCFLGLLFPTPQINHASHPVLLEIGPTRGRVGWTQPLRTSKPGCPNIVIRLSTVRHHDDGIGTGKPLPLRDIVQVAVHEMVHAYLLLLSCRRDKCDVDFDVMHRDSDGGGHGLAFVALLKAVLGQIQSWATELRDFGLTDESMHPYEDFGLELWKRGDRISSRSKGQRVWWLAAKPL